MICPPAVRRTTLELLHIASAHSIQKMKPWLPWTGVTIAPMPVRPETMAEVVNDPPINGICQMLLLLSKYREVPSVLGLPRKGPHGAKLTLFCCNAATAAANVLLSHTSALSPPPRVERDAITVVCIKTGFWPGGVVWGMSRTALW